MRAAGMQVLTDQVEAKRPGVTIWGIGDEAHKKKKSGHNEDDTPGVVAEDQDSDTLREHRAIDVKVDAAFSNADGDALVHDLVSNAENRERLIYVNWGNLQWARSNNWVARDNSDDPHDHVHVSGEADADNNTNPWVLSDWNTAPNAHLSVDGELGPKTIAKWQQIMGTKVDGVISLPKSQLVMAVQRRLRDTVDHSLVVDGEGITQNGKRYKTVAALQRYLKSPVDGVMSKPDSLVVRALQRRLNENRF